MCVSFDSPFPKFILRQEPFRPTPGAQTYTTALDAAACLCLSGKFKDISDEVPFRSLRNPWQQDTAGNCGLPGIQTLSQLSHIKKKKGRLHKSRCEIIFQVFPLPNQKNKTSADRGNAQSVQQLQRICFFSSVAQFTALITVADDSIISLHMHESMWCQPAESAVFLKPVSRIYLCSMICLSVF